jgi:SAM-dependent methyltransferase
VLHFIVHMRRAAIGSAAAELRR